ncbi:SDR family oxidoreductase [Longitalea arenae]|uniref:SDR family oxidoreductase n=1 Tax=Longitalea arenae TaxID=2812558 RepID=UPI001967F5CF|nr:SDR family oxidoreductase [Longitalea arenae]
MNRFKGKKAVVTGGTHGMGLAIVKALLMEGAHVLLTGRNEKKIDEARQQLATDAAHVLRSDASSITDIKQLRKVVEEQLGRIDYLFVNHGIAEIQELQQVTEESWDRHFNINTKGSYFTVQQLEPLINDYGAIIFTTVANDHIFPGLSAYSGSKEAVKAFAKVIAAELLPRKIRVNAVAPGFILTPTMGVPGLTEKDREEFIKQGNEVTPLKRHGTVEEVAAAALYLAAEATFTTAAELPVDGGFAQGIAN